MNELGDKQLKEIQEACLSSYRRGDREGFVDATNQLKGMAEKLAKATEEVLHGECGDEEE